MHHAIPQFLRAARPRAFRPTNPATESSARNLSHQSSNGSATIRAPLRNLCSASRIAGPYISVLRSPNPETLRISASERGCSWHKWSSEVSCMMIKAAMFIFLDTTRRHSRIYSRSSGSIPAAIFVLAPEPLRLPADPHQPPARALSSAEARTGESFCWPGRRPRVNVIAAAAANDPAFATAEDFADLPRRFDFAAGGGAFSHATSQPHASQAPQVAHFGFSPKC